MKNLTQETVKIILIFIFAWLLFKNLYSRCYIPAGEVSSKERFLKTRPSLVQSSEDLENMGDSEFMEDKTTEMFLKKMSENRKTLLLSIINGGFLPLAHSWLCNTKYMGLHKQVLFIVPDSDTRKELERNWPDIHVMEEPSYDNVAGAMRYRSVGYIKIQMYRAKMIETILKYNIDTFLFEVDQVWFRNPLDEFVKLAKENDVVITQRTNSKSDLCVCLQLIRANERSQNLWHRIAEEMVKYVDKINSANDNKHVKGGTHIQAYMSKLLRSHYGDIKVLILSSYLFADGMWYNMTETDRHPDPVLIHNNFIAGVDNKIKRAKKFKHWFWNQQTELCDEELVRSSTDRKDH